MPWKPSRLAADVTALPYARFLTAADVDVTRGEDYQNVLWREAELDGVDAVGARFSESAFSGVTVTAGSFGRSRWHDAWIGRCRWLGTDFTESDWRDVDVVGCSLAGVAASGTTMRRVRFTECKLAGMNLRLATLTDVSFEGCELTDIDIASATCKNVTFPGSTITGLRLNSSTLNAVDFRGATALGVVGDVNSLRGATVDSTQLAELAPLLAHGLGIVVNDRRAD